MSVTNPIKISVTGGPSGGKTTLIEALKKDLGPRCVVVPEAASILYRGGFPRIKAQYCQIHTQKAIYWTQRELENIIGHQSVKAELIICDRGSLDGLAYWPSQTHENFFTHIHSTQEKELARYDWVIHLDTASQHFYETSNPIRTETHEEACVLNDRLKKAWEGHPRRIIIEEKDNFLSKMTMALTVIKAITENKSYNEIRRLV